MLVVLRPMMETTQQIERLLSTAQDDHDVLAVILFGSAARGDQTPASDVDVCLVLQPRTYHPLALSRKKLAYLKQGDLDVHIFQQLPLYIRRRVLKEGKVLFERDTDALYKLAFRTAQAFEDFKSIYNTYLAEVARAGP
jgi:predicted nucleotidyltransferase